MEKPKFRIGSYVYAIFHNSDDEMYIIRTKIKGIIFEKGKWDYYVEAFSRMYHPYEKIIKKVSETQLMNDLPETT